MTAVRGAGAGRVAVELDGSPWRVLPAEAVAKAGLEVGTAVDRPRARRLRTELRRAEALDVALRSLRFRDHSRVSLVDRLAQRRVDGTAAAEAVATLERVGLLDDRRSARTRAQALADRDAGDLLIRADLERRGFVQEHIDDAIDALEPELERVRSIVLRRGPGQRTLRRLAAKGFTADALERLIADAGADELG